MKIDVVIPTTQNESWLQRALLSLIHNTNLSHIGKVVVMGDAPLKLGAAERFRESFTLVEAPQRRSWMENIIESGNYTESELVLHMHDDAMVLPGNPDYLTSMVEPFKDPMVSAVSSLLNDSAGCPQLMVRNGIPPGYYYTTWFCPIFLLVRSQIFREAVNRMPNDTYGDLVPSIEMLLKGYRLVVDAHVSQYHQGQQSNLRVYADGDVDKWLKSVRVDVREHMEATYPLPWLQRMERSEMIPAVNFYVPNGDSWEVVLHG